MRRVLLSDWMVPPIVLAAYALIVALHFAIVGCAGEQLDVADPRAVIGRLEEVAPTMASELIALCVPRPADPKAAAHCNALRSDFDYLVAGKR